MGIAAELIAQARRSAGITMAELARRAGTSTPTVSRYENGLVDPGAQTLERLLRACGFRLDALPAGVQMTTGELARRLGEADEPTPDDVTRTADGRELRTADDVEAFISELRGEGLLQS